MFSFPFFLWFLPLAGLVVLIHLINMFRHRRVRWGAMEFLLASYRKSRTRILFQQLLLMLLRTLAVLALVLMFASPIMQGQLADFFGGQGTHHIVILDDSYSMNDRNSLQGGIPLFETAKEVVKQISDNGVKRRTNDRVTLLLSSRATAVLRGEPPDFAETLLNPDNFRMIQDRLTTLDHSQQSMHPDDAFAAALGVMKQSKTKFKTVVYFVSDFRRHDWEQSATTLKVIEEIRQAGGMVRMIRMLDNARSNLAITDMTLVPGIHASNVELLFDVTIMNYGTEDAQNIPLAVIVDGRTQPTMTVPLIKSGEATVPPVRLPVRLQGAGSHRIEVRLPPDAIPDDNQRYFAIDTPTSLEVLLIATENRESALTARYLRAALSPGGATSGMVTRTESPSFLLSQPLDRFHAIVLVDTPTLEPAAIRTLEDYVLQGGGLALFFGTNTDLAFVHKELFKDGKGLMPLEPTLEETLAPDFLTKSPDMVVTDHPIFRLFREEESPLLHRVKVERYVGTTPNEPPMASVIASLRNRSPLIIENRYGKGRTITFLTTAAPIWNNWGRGNPSYVVVMLETVAWLAQRESTNRTLLVTESILADFDASKVEPVATITSFVESDSASVPVEQSASIEMPMSGDGKRRLAYAATHRAGFYTAAIKDHSGAETKYDFSVNVDAGEGDPSLAEIAALGPELRKRGCTLESASGFSAPLDFASARSLSDLLLYAVLLFLLAETLLAGWLLPPATAPRQK